MSKFLKYEKRLYEVDDRQASDMITKIERGGRIYINGELLLANKCEIIEGYPYNRDEYEIKNIQKQEVRRIESTTSETEEDYERKKKLFAEIRSELVKKLNWQRKILLPQTKTEKEWWGATGKL